MNQKSLSSSNFMSPIFSILIANRGEIASRIIRTCKKMGIKSIAVYSEIDKNALFVAEADIAIFIGNNNPQESYLNIEKIIDAAKKTQADAIHPGYGFLSENVAFAKKCQEENIIFIGPNTKAIELMGLKSQAKKLMQENNIPTIPGYQGKNQSEKKLIEEAEKIGYPILLKAAAGGGGKGMRIVHQKEELKNAIQAAKREAKNAFNHDELIIEKYIASGRHIEFQIFGDQHKNVIHILERECSIQRRYQKIIEESPSPIMNETLRNKMGQVAVNAAKVLDYDNAGTVEFILNDDTNDFYFLEINTRLQVEHPITEEITGLDLVQMQIESAQGIPLSISQENIQGKGYAIECRLYAEDPNNNFLPVTGTIKKFEAPKLEGLRIETAIKNNSIISIFYDPMIAKLIIWDTNRINAIRKMKYVLKNLVCLGIKTNQDFLIQILNQKDFQIGNYNTQFIHNNIHQILSKPNFEFNQHLALIAASIFNWNNKEKSRNILKSIPSGWRNNFYKNQQRRFIIEEKEIDVEYQYKNKKFNFFILKENYHVELIEEEKNYIRLEINEIQYTFKIINKKNNYFIHNEIIGNIHIIKKDRFPQKEKEKIQGGYEAPMPSQVIKILVKKGQKISKGDGLIVLSSMKMENTIEANKNGIVEEIYAQEGKNIEAGFLLLQIKTEQ